MAAPKNDTGLTRERLRESLDYEPDTGVFRWRVSRGPVRAGSVAGTRHSEGYLSIEISRRPYLAHRLAFLWMTGAFPADQVDHRNGVRDDNRWSNLREATRSENLQNIGGAQRNNRSSGLLGAYRNRDKWLAKINVDGKRLYLGTFPTPELAHASYLQAKRELHPASCRLGEA